MVFGCSGGKMKVEYTHTGITLIAENEADNKRIERFYEGGVKINGRDVSYAELNLTFADLIRANGMATADKIDKLFNNFKELLKEKNRRYGDSALKPIKIFAQSDAHSQICSRLDDKLSRIANSEEMRKNDICDILGYIALLMIEQNWLEFDDLID
jgi:hypothetical protein